MITDKTAPLFSWLTMIDKSRYTKQTLKTIRDAADTDGGYVYDRHNSTIMDVLFVTIEKGRRFYGRIPPAEK